MIKKLSILFLLMLISSSVFAEYGYHYSKNGTGYWRDDSNDGDPTNNANALGMNRKSRYNTQGYLNS